VQCPRCRAENRDEARFCRECGATFSSACPSCGAKVEAGSRFCDGCGARLTAAGSPEARPSRFSSPEVYTPKHLAEKILTSKAALEGERKQITVLFADLKGSMELLADRDPEEARKILDPVLELMMEAVHRYEGTVNQVMGDGIMALFGAPLAHEDHAVRACYAALRMQEQAARYAAEARCINGANVKIRVGLNSGEVVVRAIGSDLHMDYTAVGQTTHLAARMEQMAAPGVILLAPATLRLAEDFIQVAPQGPVPVKGLADPVDIYLLTGAVARTRLQAGVARGLTTFVGRESEIEQMRRSLTLVRDSHGQLVAVVGEPGVGKSRLFHEFMRPLSDQGWFILEAGSVSYGKATSYLPVTNLLKTYFQIESHDDTQRIQERVVSKLLALDRTLEPTLTAFLTLLDVPVDDPQWQALDPPQRRQRTLDACKHLLLRESQDHPLLVVFEDLHWIDGETQALLDSLVDSLPSARVLLLVNYRPEYRHAWGTKTFYTQLRADPLPDETADAMLRALLGDDPDLGPLKLLLIARTQGNPFFLEEIVRTLVETKILVGAQRAYRLTSAVQSLHVPATAQAVLAARIDRLGPEEKRLLQTAAVIGKDVPFALLRAIAEDADEPLRRGLAALQAAEFIHETQLFPDREYSFKHALTHDITFGTILHDRRRATDRKIVDAIESLYPDRLPEYAERLAHHAFRGEVWLKAAAYSRQAGLKAMGRSALREAATWLQQALFAFSHLGDAQDVRSQALDIRFSLRTVLLQLGHHQSAIENLLGAVALAEALDDQPRLARAHAFLTTSYVFAGDYSHALESGHRVMALDQASRDPILPMEMEYRFGQVYYGIGDYERAAEMLRRSLNSLPIDTSRMTAFNPFVFWRVYLALCLVELGDFDEGLRLLEEALPAGRASQQPFDLVGVHWGLGSLQIRRGHQAQSLLERSFELCKTKSLHLLTPIIGSLLGLAYCRSGLFADGLALLNESSTAGEGIFPFSSQVAANLSEGYLLVYRLTEARDAVERALAVARGHAEKGHEAWALRLLADICSHSRPAQIETAAAYYQDALAIAPDLGMRPLVAHCHLGLGKLYQRTGRRDQAQEHLTIAKTMYREMDMRFWLEQAEAELHNLA
jgi:class 3 adenylate cyclase/tetratricopeptide (TPR) repeat protein